MMPELLESCPVLKEMFESQSAKSRDGQTVPLNSNISILHAQCLYDAVLREKPTAVLEVGMAFGTASLAILSALQKNGGAGKLITIDPVQSTEWKGCGLAGIERAELANRHEMIEDFDYFALPNLLRSGARFQFAYIDGWHTFDYTLVDFWYADKMLDEQGIIAINDCGWPAVNKAIRFILSHRKYEEIDVGLLRRYRTWGRVQETLARLSGKKKGWGRRSEDRYFRKEANWEPNWDFYAQF
jgi:predicted O-methyltransferase YrrM